MTPTGDLLCPRCGGEWCKCKGYTPLSELGLKQLQHAIDRAKTEPPVYLGSFAQYVDADLECDVPNCLVCAGEIWKGREP